MSKVPAIKHLRGVRRLGFQNFRHNVGHVSLFEQVALQ